MLNIKEIIESTKGKHINGDLNIIPTEYVIDSREVSKNDFFVPIVGQNTDSHKYIIECVKKGIIGFFIESNYIDKENIIKEVINLNKEICIVEVEKTSDALYEAAKYNRNKHIDIPVVAVTGSVGKTSTREMIASVLKKEYNLLITKKNYNSYIGLYLMLLKIKDQDICVLEIGIDRFGEMDILTEIVKPDVAVITMIGTAHIGIFKNKENIFKEKLNITNGIKGLSKLIVNGDDNFLNQLINTKKYSVEKYSMNEVEKIDIQNDNLEFETKIYNEMKKIKISEIGKHNIYNALSAIKVAEIFKMKSDNIIKGIEEYRNFSKRLEKKYIGDNILIIDDTYNASIDSMISGLESVNNLKGGRKIAVLGDMFELGEYSDELHIEIGKKFKDLNFDCLYTLGGAAKNISIEAKKYMNKDSVFVFEDKKKLVDFLKNNLIKNDIVYFKASNGMKFFEIIEELQ